MQRRIPIINIVQQYRNRQNEELRENIDPRLYTAMLSRDDFRGDVAFGFTREMAKTMTAPGRDKTVADAVAYLVNFGPQMSFPDIGERESALKYLTGLAQKAAPDMEESKLREQVLKVEEGMKLVIKQLQPSASPASLW